MALLAAKQLLDPIALILRSGSTSVRTMANKGPIERSITRKLQDEFNATHVQVINESYMHNVPKGAETHFKVVVVSDKFDGLPLLQRHRLVNTVLKMELENGVHALSIIAKSPEQWEESEKVVARSPTCKGIRFGKMQMISGLITLLKKYRVSLAEGQSTRVEFDPKTPNLQPKGHLRLKLSPRDGWIHRVFVK